MRKITVLLTGIIIMALIVIGCGASSEVKADTTQTDSEIPETGSQTRIQESSHSLDIPRFAAYSQLTYNKFMDILDSEDPFSIIRIDYRMSVRCELQDDELILFGLGSGKLGEINYMNSIDLYRSNIYHARSGDAPLEGEYIEAEYESSTVNLIFDYITHEDNRDYFFSGDEYSGLIQPYDTRTVMIHDNTYVFVLAVFEPDSMSANAWAISKDIDVPDDIWEGLIDILEANFLL